MICGFLSWAIMCRVLGWNRVALFCGTSECSIEICRFGFLLFLSRICCEVVNVVSCLITLTTMFSLL